MADRVLGQSGGRRRRRSLALLSFAGLLALALTLWLAIGAGAVSDKSGFEDEDGNLIPQAPINFDWNSFAPLTGDAAWMGTAPNRTSEKTQGPWDFDGIEDAQATTSDNAFAGGTKQDEECASVITQKAPNKDDLKRVYFANGTVPVEVEEDVFEDHVFLNLAWVRIPQNTTSPSAHVAFEFNQSETDCAGPGDLVERSTDNGGDVLIVYDFEGGATDTPTIRLSRWVGTGACEVAQNDPPCWGPADVLDTDEAEARVNTSTVGPVSDALAPPDNSPPPPPETLGLNEFGEAGIDLTEAGVFPEGECRSFGNAFAVSRTSGSSATAQMKDLVGPGNVDIRNCGQIIINKVTDPSPDPTDTAFDYETGGPDGPLDPATFALKDGESQDFGDQVQAGQYSVTEQDPGPDFALTDITCAVTGEGGSTTATNLDGRTARINLQAEDVVECTFTNTFQTIGTDIKTKQSWFPNDTATVSAESGNLAAGGKVLFELFTNATCTGASVFSEEVDVPGGSPSAEVGTDNTSYEITTGYADPADSTVGRHSWRVTYTPAAVDTAHTGSRSTCDSEHFNIPYTNDPGPGTDLP